MNETILYIISSIVLSSGCVQLLKQSIKNWILPRFGDAGVLATLACIAVIFSGMGYFGNLLPENIIVSAGIIFSGAVTLYQSLKAVYNKALLNILDSNDK